MYVIRKYIKKNRSIMMFIGLIVLSSLVLLFSSKEIILKPKEYGFSVFSIMQNGFSQVGSFISETVNSISELKELKKEYEDLQNKLNEYKEIERDIVELKQENDHLKEQLGFSERIEFKYIPAEIIGKDPGNFFNAIIIDKGSRDKIKKGSTVIAFQHGFRGILGKIIEVGLISSVIKPIYDNSCYVAARIQKSGYQGLIQGGGSNYKNLYMKYVKKRAKDEIQYGDLVVTSGLQSIYPKGIYIGRVRSINAREWDVSLALEVEPIIDLSNLEYVFVLDSEE